jgi:hypothetical protein
MRQYNRREKLKLTKEKKNKKKHEHGFQAASRILKRKKREKLFQLPIVLIKQTRY